MQSLRATNPDDFQAAIDKLDSLKEEYNQLQREVPSLRQAKALLKDEVKNLQQKTADKTADLDNIIGKGEELLATARKQAETVLNEATSTIEAERREFDSYKETQSSYLQKRERSLEESKEKLRLEKEANDELSESLKEKQDETTEFIAMNQRHNERLEQREQKVTERESAVALKEQEIAIQAEAFKEREADIAQKEAQIAQDLQQASDERKNTTILMTKAKEDLAHVDSKENELIMREKQVKARKQELDKREIALNDRGSILDSHLRL